MRFSIRIVAAAALAVAFSSAIITLQTQQYVEPAPPDDGMIYPVELPMLPRFSITCAVDGYCDPATDSVCTITYVGLVYGTDPNDLTDALRAMWPDITAADMTDCPTFTPLLAGPIRQESAQG